jgi:hypothetical protein
MIEIPSPAHDQLDIPAKKSQLLHLVRLDREDVSMWVAQNPEIVDYPSCGERKKNARMMTPFNIAEWDFHT